MACRASTHPNGDSMEGEMSMAAGLSSCGMLRLRGGGGPARLGPPTEPPLATPLACAAQAAAPAPTAQMRREEGGKTKERTGWAAAFGDTVCLCRARAAAPAPTAHMRREEVVKNRK